MQTVESPFGQAEQNKLAKIYPNSDAFTQQEWHEILIAGCRYYGVINWAIKDNNSRLASKAVGVSGKSYADDFLKAQFGIDSYTAHFAMNQITHHNLPSLWIDYATMTECYSAFADQPVAKVIAQIAEAEQTCN